MATEQAKILVYEENGRGVLRKLNGSFYRSFSNLSKAVQYCERQKLAYKVGGKNS